MISACVTNRLSHLICVKLWNQIRITVWHLISSSKGLGFYVYCGGRAWLNLQKTTDMAGNWNVPYWDHRFNRVGLRGWVLFWARTILFIGRFLCVCIPGIFPSRSQIKGYKLSSHLHFSVCIFAQGIIICASFHQRN